MTAGVQDPSRAYLRAHRTRKPGVEYISLARESARFVALGLVVSRCGRLHRVDRQHLGRRQNRIIPVGLTKLVQPVPQRKSDSKVSLPADAPVELQVLGPVAISHPHKVRVPLDAVAHVDQPRFLVHQSHKPLTRRYEFQRPLALLVELYRMLNWLWRLDQWWPVAACGSIGD